MSSLFQNPLLSIPFLLPHWLLGKGPTLCKRSCERRRSQHGSKAQLSRKKRRTVENSRREAGTRGKTKKKKKNGWPGGHWNREGRKVWGTTLSEDDFVCPRLKPPARTFWAGGLSPTGTHRRGTSFTVHRRIQEGQHSNSTTCEVFLPGQRGLDP